MHIRKTKIKKCMNLCLGCINLGYMNLCLGYFWGLQYFKMYPRLIGKGNFRASL